MPDLSEVHTWDALLFDWDGTLVDSHAAHFQSLRGTLASEGITVHQDWYASTTGVSAADKITWLAEDQGVGLTTSLDELLSRCEASYLDHLDLVHEITWVADLARTWHGRKPLAVASGGAAHTITRTMTHTGLTGLFDTLVSRDDVTAGKPAPDIFLLAAARLDIPPTRCLVLEDSDAGIEAARRAGASVMDIRTVQPIAEPHN